MFFSFRSLELFPYYKPLLLIVLEGASASVVLRIAFLFRPQNRDKGIGIGFRYGGSIKGMGQVRIASSFLLYDRFPSGQS